MIDIETTLHSNDYALNRNLAYRHFVVFLFNFRITLRKMCKNT